MIFAFLSLVVFLILVFLGVWVLYRGYDKRLNRVFALYVAAFALWVIARFGMRVAPTADVALTFAKISGLGWIFLGATFLHFVLVFAERKKILENKLSYLALYGPGIIFLSILWFTGEVYSGMEPAAMGFEPVHEWGVLAPIAHVCVTLILGAYYGIKEYRKRAGLGRAQNILIAAIAFIFLVSNIVRIVLPHMDINTYECVGVINLSVVLIFAIAVTECRLLILPPITRFFVPAPEAYLRTKPKYRLEVGRAYLVKEKEADHSLRLFMDQVTHGIPGLWITSLPSKKMVRYGLRKTLVLSITATRFPGEVTLPPTKLDSVKALVLNRFLYMRGRSVVMVDCFKELVVANGFERVMDFMKEMVKMFSQNNSNLIVRIDPDKYTKKQLVAIEKVVTLS